MPSSSSGAASNAASTGTAAASKDTAAASKDTAVTTKTEEKKVDGSIIAGAAVGSVLLMIFTIISSILYAAGAARLSYLKYGSIVWAVIDFFFAPFYYPFYALVLAEPVPASTGALFGGGRMAKKMMKLFG